MADAADLKSASHKEYGFDPRPGYQLSFYEKRKLGKEKRRIAFLKKAWQKLPWQYSKKESWAKKNGVSLF